MAQQQPTTRQQWLEDRQRQIAADLELGTPASIARAQALADECIKVVAVAAWIRTGLDVRAIAARSAAR